MEENKKPLNSSKQLSDWISGHMHTKDVKKHLEHEQSFNKSDKDTLQKRMSSDLFK